MTKRKAAIQSIDITRRRLLETGGLACGVIALENHSMGSTFAASIDAARPRAAPTQVPLTQLKCWQVQLHSGPLQRQARGNHRLLMQLDHDALLRPFRLREGLDAPGTDLGGWYDADAFAPGGNLRAMDKRLIALLCDHWRSVDARYGTSIGAWVCSNH